MHVTLAPEVRGRPWSISSALANGIRVAAVASALFLLLQPLRAEAPRRLVSAPLPSMPSLVLPDLDGRQVDAASVRADAVLVHFFATWCEPCREEFASLARLTGSGRNIKVLAINVAEVPVRVRRFLESVHVPFPILLDADRAVTKAWDVSVLPTTYVLDRAKAARLFVEGDLDWMRPDVVAALEGVMHTPAASPIRDNKAKRGNP